jgi:hypothetical protein
MSLLMDALKKAELAKRQGRRKRREGNLEWQGDRRLGAGTLAGGRPHAQASAESGDPATWRSR